MSIVSLPNIGGGSDPATINVSVLNGKVDPLATDYNGNIQNVNIAAGAGIVYTKLTLTDSVVNADINSAAAIASSKLDLSAVAQTVVMSSKAINAAKGSDIASATTTDIGAMVGNYGDVTGTTTITGLGTVAAGSQRVVRFTGALTLTHNGTSLLLPSAANITTAANDVAGFVSLGSGNWKCLWYQRYDGTSLVGFNASTAKVGSVIQTVATLSSAVDTTTQTIPNDDSPPQAGSEGKIFLTRTITPNASGNLLKVDCTIFISHSAAGGVQAFLSEATTGDDALMVGAQYYDGGATGTNMITFTYYFTTTGTSQLTFELSGGASQSGTTTLNGSSGSRLYGTATKSSIVIQEIKA